MTSEQPTHIKINPQLFLCTRDGCGSMKPCLPFLLAQIQRDGFQWLACPGCSEQQDSCVPLRHHGDTADSTGTEQAVYTGCGLVWLRRPSRYKDMGLWKGEGQHWYLFDVFSMTKHTPWWLFPILTHTCQACLVKLVNLVTAWVLHLPGHEFLHLHDVTWGWIIPCFGAVKALDQFCVCFYAQAHEIRN